MERNLERRKSAVARPPRNYLRRAMLLIILAAASVLAANVVRRLTSRDCAAAARLGADGAALIVCQREYEQTKEPRTGVQLADALYGSGNLNAALSLAQGLLDTAVRADALQVLGKIAAVQGRTDDATSALQDARRLHREQVNHIGLATDE